MIELVVADTMQPNGCARRYHEIERRASRPPSSEWRGQSPWRNPLLAHERHPHESARGVRLELQQVANLIGSQFIGYLCHRISRRSLRVHRQFWRHDGSTNECCSLEKISAANEL